MILIIDNYDSFVYNIYQYVSQFTKSIKVIRNDELTLEQVKALNPNKIIISPGPKSPKDAGISLEVIRQLYKETPILGICLGHQCISEVFGDKVVIAEEIRHGKVSEISIEKEHYIFNRIPKKLNVVRYHSLVIPKSHQLEKEFEILAHSCDDNEIMAIAHKNYPLIGLQFHPESILTEHGITMIENFITI